uniref:RIMS-binding protein 2 n=1 Tax=Macrostomum lignano TaxID=282301 RepID=A0A1I8F4I6_9PLAT
NKSAAGTAEASSASAAKRRCCFQETSSSVSLSSSFSAPRTWQNLPPKTPLLGETAGLSVRLPVCQPFRRRNSMELGIRDPVLKRYSPDYSRGVSTAAGTSAASDISDLSASNSSRNRGGSQQSGTSLKATVGRRLPHRLIFIAALDCRGQSPAPSSTEERSRLATVTAELQTVRDEYQDYRSKTQRTLDDSQLTRLNREKTRTGRSGPRLTKERLALELKEARNRVFELTSRELRMTEEARMQLQARVNELELQAKLHESERARLKSANESYRSLAAAKQIRDDRLGPRRGEPVSARPAGIRRVPGRYSGRRSRSGTDGRSQALGWRLLNANWRCATAGRAELQIAVSAAERSLSESAAAQSEAEAKIQRLETELGELKRRLRLLSRERECSRSLSLPIYWTAHWAGSGKRRGHPRIHRVLHLVQNPRQRGRRAREREQLQAAEKLKKARPVCRETGGNLKIGRLPAADGEAAAATAGWIAKDLAEKQSASAEYRSEPHGEIARGRPPPALLHQSSWLQSDNPCERLFDLVTYVDLMSRMSDKTSFLFD